LEAFLFLVNVGVVESRAEDLQWRWRPAGGGGEPCGGPALGARRRMGTKDEAAGAVLGSRCMNQGRRRLCVWTGVSGVNQGRGIGG
jgi:hypothetical protein